MVPHSFIEIDEIDDTEMAGKSSVNKSLLVGSIVTYTCEKGYRLIGSRQILCLQTGLYDHAVPSCTGNLYYLYSSYIFFFFLFFIYLTLRREKSAFPKCFSNRYMDNWAPTPIEL